MNNIIMLPGSIDACAQWRMFFPHLRLPNSRFLFNPAGQLPIEEIIKFKVAAVQRLASRENLEGVRVIKRNGLKVIYDLDDNLWNIPKYNPHYTQWIQAQEAVRICMSACDHITVSTPALSAAVRRFVSKKLPVTVIPNCVDFDMYKPLPLIEKEKVIVGWAGSATHSGDTAELYSFMGEVLAKNESMRFEIAGSSIPDELRGLDKVSMRFHVPIAEYPSRLASWRWDVIVAPLVNNLFNRSKSNIKILEGAALKTPVLFSPVATYLDFAGLDKQLDWLVCRTKQQWKDKIAALVNEPERRKFYGELLYTTAKKYYSTDIAATRWQAVADSL